jgi:hypothetical protein
MIFRNILFYYLLLALPLAALIILAKNHEVNSTFFVGGLAVYVFLYHPLISGLRLLNSGKIRRSEFLYNFIPLWNLKYFGFLFLNQ